MEVGEMADPKIVKARQRQKTDTTANWEKAANFVPLKGEIIVYQDSGVAPKFKIGDGTSTVGDLKFVSGGLTLEDIDATLSKSGKAADAKVTGDGIKSLVSRVTTTERNIETNSDNISTLQNQANTNSSNISILQGEAETNSDNITTLQGQVNNHSSEISTLQGQVKDHSNDISTLKDQAKNYATKTYVQEEISKAELGGGGDIDVSNLATKQDLVDLIDESLKESGKAADAKIVGERFDSLDIIVAIDENSDGNVVLRPYLGEGGVSNWEDLQNKPSIEAGQGKNSIVLGGSSQAPGDYSHAEGYQTETTGVAAHAEGAIYNNVKTSANGQASHAEGAGTRALVDATHTEGILTLAGRTYAEAQQAAIDLNMSFDSDEELYMKLLGYGAHAEGTNTQALGSSSHAEGSLTQALANSSHAEGDSTYARGEASHAEGYDTTASGNQSHAEGRSTLASGNSSHAEGKESKATGYCAHAEGLNTLAQGLSSHAEGIETIALTEAQHVQGRYNIEDTADTYAHIVGNGTEEDGPSNAHTLDWHGNAWYAGVVTAGADPTNDMDLVTKQYLQRNALSIVNMTIEEVEPPLYFYIYDTKYEAEAGMTWAEWCNSAYNTYGAWVDESDDVYTQYWEEIRYYDKSTQSMGDLVYGSHIILETKYVTYNP